MAEILRPEYFCHPFSRPVQIRSFLDILSFNAGITAQATYTCSPCISQIHSLYSFIPDSHHLRLSGLRSYKYSFCSSIFSLRSFYHYEKHMSRNLKVFCLPKVLNRIFSFSLFLLWNPHLYSLTISYNCLLCFLVPL